jgi:dTDP-4-dehydrorhamnose reductase
MKVGIYNVVGPDYCSRYIFAIKIARALNLDETLIKPVLTTELNQKAKRPLKAGLIIDRIRGEIDAKPRSLDEVLEQIKHEFP